MTKKSRGIKLKQTRRIAMIKRDYITELSKWEIMKKI